jgi:small-conductance mechanosensitive channel
MRRQKGASFMPNRAGEVQEAAAAVGGRPQRFQAAGVSSQTAARPGGPGQASTSVPRGGLESIGKAFEDLRGMLDWAPDGVASGLVLGIAAALALAFHRAIVAGVRRLLRDRHPYLRLFLGRTRAHSRMVLLVLAIALAMPAAPLPPQIRSVLAHLLLLAVIILIAWAVIIAIGMASEIYLMRFRLDVADNLLARKHVTQIRILRRTLDTLVVVIATGAALMTFEPVRQYGVSLFASAGVAGLVVGLAARPMLTNLIAGVQIAMTQPIRIEDAVLVENEFGWVEEINATYVVIRLWDWRRLVVPLAHFIEKPFQNWTREGAAIIGSVMLYLDYTAPVERIRTRAKDFVTQSKLWNGQVFNVQVTEARSDTMELRILVSANSAGDAFDLRCEVREKLLDFLQREHPHALPRGRHEIANPDAVTLVPQERQKRGISAV